MRLIYLLILFDQKTERKKKKQWFIKTQINLKEDKKFLMVLKEKYFL